MDFILSNEALLILDCNLVVLFWLMIVTDKPSEFEDPDKNTTAWN